VREWSLIFEIRKVANGFLLCFYTQRGDSRPSDQFVFKDMPELAKFLDHKKKELFNSSQNGAIRPQHF
jgi:hypothetical protein